MQKLVVALALAGLGLAGCSTLSDTANEDARPVENVPTRTVDTENKTVTEDTPAKPVTYAPFPADVLYSLLTAEVAAQRGRYDVTLVNYVQSAKKSKDPAIISRAMQIARALGGDNAQMQLAQTWLEVDPDNLEALQTAAVQNIRNKRYEPALAYMERILTLGGDPDFDHLAAYAKSLSDAERVQLVGLYENLSARHPNNPEVTYSLALLKQSSGMAAEALKALEPILEDHPDFQPAILLNGALLYETGERAEALKYLRRNARRYPDNRKLGTLYARMLIEDQQLQAAEDEFQALSQRFPETTALTLSYALVALENNHRDEASRIFNALLDDEQHVDEAHFYLARIADEAKQFDKAIAHYQQVESGGQYLPALARSSLLMARRGELTTALDNLHTLREQLPQQSESFWLIEVNLLNELGEDTAAIRTASEALTAYPENLRLRYVRSMLLDKTNQLDAMEEDLRFILEREPNNAVALNALGYTLTLKSERLNEAFDLIRKAHTLAPDNPAILDSLGWVHFRRGEIREALAYLKQAYDKYPDAEIAAHYGEVLWVAGEEEEALRIWAESIQTHPNDTLVPAARNRLQGDDQP